LPEIAFRPLTQEDLAAIHRWLNNPEVARWYGIDPGNKKYPSYGEVVADYEDKLGLDAGTHAFIMQVDGRDAGYIQCYRIGEYPEYAAAIGMDADAWAIDLFIGEDDVRGRGLGPALLTRFLAEHVFSRPGVAICLICPDPENTRAVRAYEKAGFRHVKTVWVEEENEHESVMRIDRRQTG
jgi:RimJ/RimL family protein N-acetyltransferase